MAFDGRLTGPFTVVCSSAEREVWLRQRLTGIGASEIAAVMNCNRYEAALRVYARKIGAIGIHEDPAGEAAYWSSRLERIVAGLGGAMRVSPNGAENQAVTRLFTMTRTRDGSNASE